MNTPSPLSMPARMPQPASKPIFTTTTGDGLGARIERSYQRDFEQGMKDDFKLTDAEMFSVYDS